MILLIAALILLLIAGLYHILTPPSNFPRNIPTIPIWVSFLGFFTPLDQLEIYSQHLEPYLRQHGAAKYFFGGRWNILVQSPDLLSDVLKHENVFAKSGNQKKIPYSVLAAFTGDNVISAHGEAWKLYREVMKPGLQRHDFDVNGIRKNAQNLAGLLLEAQKELQQHKGVAVNPLIQRFAMQALGQTVLGTDFKTLESATSRIHTIHTQLKMQIFKPLYLTMPFLDRFPIKSRRRARALVDEFEDELVKTVLEQTEILPEDDDMLVSLMKRARRDGTWTERQFRDNLKIVFIAGHENVQQLLNSLLYVLAKHPQTQQQLRDEFRVDHDDESMKSSPLLTSVLLETLRLFPPIPQLVNRKTTAAVLLGNIPIPKDTYVGWTATGAHRDTAAWGSNAEEFQPERWGNTPEQIHGNMRKHTSKSQFIPFHGGRRACLGQNFAMLEVRAAIVELLRISRWRFEEEDATVKFTPGGLLAPMGMRLVFEDLKA